MPAEIHVNQGKARVVIPSRGGIAAIGGSQVPSAFGEDGREVQLQKSATHIQWRYEGDAAWTNLVSLSELEGDPGANGTNGTNGAEIELQKSATHIQWRYVGGATWTNLVALSELTGEQGEQGEIGFPGFKYDARRIGADQYVIGEIIEYQGSYYICLANNDAIVPAGAALGVYWAAHSFGGGGGGDYLPLAGGTMDANASIIWGNASAIREAGAQGLEIECSVGYRWQWVAGRMILRQINSGQIQRVLAIDGVTPGDTEDISEGFIVGTRWETQDGTIYECTDSTDSAAVWENITPIPISTPGIAYVNSGGDDSTGAIGDPSKPYLTAQAAWDDGARNLELGGGSYTISHYTTSDGTGQEMARICGIGKDSTSLTINWSGTPATEESPAGKLPVKPILVSDQSVSLTINLSGSDAHSGDNNGGAAPPFEFQHCYIASFYTVGGNGSGSGSSGSISGGTTKWCEVQSAFGGGSVIDFLATLEGNYFKGGLLASNVVYGGSNVDAALVSLTDRVAQETYMRTTDFFDSSGTVSDVTGLSCAVAANEKVLIEIVGFRAGGAAGSGLKIQFTGPSSPTDVKYTLEHWNAVNTGRTVIAATSFNTVLTQADVNMDYLPIRVTLTLINGPTGDTVRFRAASEGSGTNITLLKGLTMRVHRIP